MPPSLSFRGAKRRGNLLQPVAFSPGVTCYPTGSCEIATAPLGPRNDKSGGIAPMSLCRNHCQPAWRSLTAATDAIGAHRFVEALYESQPLRREGHAPPLQGVCGRRSTQKIGAAHGASRTPPPTRRVRSAGIPGNLQLPKALTERRYRRNRLVRFYRHLVRTGSAFPRLPRRFAPRNDNSEVHTILTMACTSREYRAGRGMPLPYNSRSAALRKIPRSAFHVFFHKFSLSCA